MNNLLTDESRSIEPIQISPQMRHDIVLFKHKLITKEELLRKHPSVEIFLLLVEGEVKQSFEEQRKSILEYINKAINTKFSTLFYTILGPILAYNQLLLDAPYIAYIAPSYQLSRFIADEFDQAFVKSRMNKVAKIIFISMFTAIFSSYTQALMWAFWYGKEAYPILIMRITSLQTEIFQTLLTEMSIGSRKLKAEAVGFFGALFSGKTGQLTRTKLLELYNNISIEAIAYTTALLKIEGADFDAKELKTIPEGEEMYDRYKKIKPKFTQEQELSAYTLLRPEDIKILGRNFTKVSTIGMELALYEQAPIEKYTKIFSLVQELHNIFENPTTDIASSMFNTVSERLVDIAPEIADYIDLHQFRQTGKNLDNKINDATMTIKNDVEYYMYKIGESWNSRTLFLPKGPDIQTIYTALPYSDRKTIESTGINLIDYMLLYTILLSLFLYLKRTYFPKRDVPHIEAMRICRNRK